MTDEGLVKCFDFGRQHFEDPNLLDLALEAVDFEGIFLVRELLNETGP